MTSSTLLLFSSPFLTHFKTEKQRQCVLERRLAIRKQTEANCIHLINENRWNPQPTSYSLTARKFDDQLYWSTFQSWFNSSRGASGWRKTGLSCVLWHNYASLMILISFLCSETTGLWASTSNTCSVVQPPSVHSGGQGSLSPSSHPPPALNEVWVDYQSFRVIL